MEMNFNVLFLAALVPMIIGFVWYGPLFGNAWMKEMNFTKESLAETNMLKTLVLSYMFSLFIAFFLMFVVIHQSGVYSTLAGEPGFNENTGEAFTYFQDFLNTYGDRFRTFRHGVIHGVLTSIAFVLPILSIIALFDKKSFKYLAINAGYWMLTLAVMGGIVCKWL
jgi:Fe2+ transport system protein B